MSNKKEVNEMEVENMSNRGRGFLVWLIFLPIMGVLAALFSVVFFNASWYVASIFALCFLVCVGAVAIITSWWEKLTEKQQTTVYKVVAVVGGIAFVLWVTWSLGRAS